MSRVGDSPPWSRRGGCASNKNDAKPPQPGADGAVRSIYRLIGSYTNRPVRSNRGGFATSLLMLRPPRLDQGGESLLRDIFNSFTPSKTAPTVLGEI